MLGFVLFLAFLPFSWCSPIEKFDLPTLLRDARLGDLTDLCEWFCSDWDYDYYDFFSRSSGKDKIQPRIFCGLCPAEPTTSSTAPPTSSAAPPTSSAAPPTSSAAPSKSSDTPSVSSDAPTMSTAATTGSVSQSTVSLTSPAQSSTDSTTASSAASTTASTAPKRR